VAAVIIEPMAGSAGDPAGLFEDCAIGKTSAADSMRSSPAPAASVRRLPRIQHHAGSADPPRHQQRRGLGAVIVKQIGERSWCCPEG
jgi:hypothetical protein